MRRCSASWAESNCRKLFRKRTSWLDPETGEANVRKSWTTKLPAKRKTRRTNRRVRNLRVCLSDGTVKVVECRVAIRKDKRADAYVSIGRRKVVARGTSLRMVWRRVIIGVEALLRREKDVQRLIDSPPTMDYEAMLDAAVANGDQYNRIMTARFARRSHRPGAPVLPDDL